MSKFWNFIVNEQDNSEVELRISGDIVSDDDAWIYEWFGIQVASPNAFRSQLLEHKGKNITVWIDSPGGDVFAGAGIYNALKEHNGKVVVKIDGKAMSAASVIAMAGDEISMSPVGMMMIHNPWSSTVGEAKDMRHAADVLDEVKETIINAYQLKTGKSRKKISEMMDNETFMSAKTAVKEGFADNILYMSTEGEPEHVENSFMFSRMDIRNSIAASMIKFFRVAKLKDTQRYSAHQAQAAEQKPDANITNTQEGEEPMFKDVKELRNAYPDFVKQIEDAAREEGRTQERARIQNIEKISKNIDPALVDKAKYEEPMDAKELAFNALQSDNQKGKNYLNNALTDNQSSGVENISPASAVEEGDNKPKTMQDRVKNIAANFDARRRGVNK